MPQERLFGVATVSSSTAVGKTVPFTGAQAGAMAVQGFTSPYFGVAGMKMLREGREPSKVLADLLADDPIRESRQLLLVDAAGRTAAFTGSALPEYAGSLEGDRYVIGGCGLGGAEVLTKCAVAFQESQGDFAARLLAAVAAAAGGDASRSPVKSVALRVSKDESFPYLDLRVDRHDDPVRELSLLLSKWREKNGPLETTRPPRNQPRANG